MKSPSVRLALRAWLGGVFLIAIALTVLAYGSVTVAALNIAAFTFAALAGLSAAYPIDSLAVSRVQAASIVLLAGLLAYAAFQAAPFEDGAFVNAAWRSVSQDIGGVRGTISVAPGLTIEALTSLALPFLVFISGLAYFQGDGGALRLWRALAHFGAAYAIFGILQELFFQKQLLFEVKKHNIGSLTASFVNQNTAGTLFGIVLIASLGLAFQEFRRIHVRRFFGAIFNMELRWRDTNARAAIQALLCVVVAVALFLTKSRGAVAGTFVACVIVVVLMATRRLTADNPWPGFSTWRRAAAAICGMAIVVGLFAIFAARSLYRIQTEGVENGRWCTFASTIQAIRDNWALGAGFGAFRDVFPVYRNPGCTGISGIWDRAHDFFLEGYVGLGVAFAVALVIGYAILIGIFIYGIRSRRRLRFIPVAGLAVLVFVSLHSIVDFSLQIAGVYVYFAAIMAATVSVSLGGGRHERLPSVAPHGDIDG